VLNNRFTFADILVAQTFNWADRFNFEMQAEHLNYRDRMYDRKAVADQLSLDKSVKACSTALMYG